MTRTRFLVFGIALAIAALVWVRATGEPPAAVDLVAKLSEADCRPHDAGNGLFSVSKKTIAGSTRRAVFVRPVTRITWDIVVPNRAFLRTAMGVDPSAWDKDPDGVQYRVAVAVGKRFEPLMARRLDPRHVPADRAWVPVVIDLSKYSGQRVHLVLATDPGVPGTPAAAEDLAYWAAPAITLR